jgi:AcrR family transcriptional regulator
VPTAAPPEPGRGERRKARTRAALVGAAQRILADRGTADVAISEITDEADVGFGSFYNHFRDKDELFEEAVLQVLEGFGAALDAACADIHDPAEVFAVGVRLTCRLATMQPAIARILVQSGPHYLISERGLAPQALRDLRRAIEAGRLDYPRPRLALVIAAGSVLSYVQVRLTGEDLTDDDADLLAESLLTTFGMPALDAESVAHRPLPELAAPAGAQMPGPDRGERR